MLHNTVLCLGCRPGWFGPTGLAPFVGVPTRVGRWPGSSGGPALRLLQHLFRLRGSLLRHVASTSPRLEERSAGSTFDATFFGFDELGGATFFDFDKGGGGPFRPLDGVLHQPWC